MSTITNNLFSHAGCVVMEKPLARCVRSLLVCSALAVPMTGISTLATATDLDIYQAEGAAINESGPVVMMMLDTSGSMGGPLSFQTGGGVDAPFLNEEIAKAIGFTKPPAVGTLTSIGKTYSQFLTNGIPNNRTWIGSGLNSIEKDYGLGCEVTGNPNFLATPKYHQLFAFKAVVAGKPEIDFTIEGCKVDGKYYYTRLGRMQLALVGLLADNIISEDTKATTTYPDLRKGGFRVGLGNYPALNSNGMVGSILVPAKPLTLDHRHELITKLVALKAFGPTPSAHAYAEVGSYMLGSAPARITQGERYRISGGEFFTGGKYYYHSCTQRGSYVKSKINGKEYDIEYCSGWSSPLVNRYSVKADGSRFTEADAKGPSNFVATNTNSTIKNDIYLSSPFGERLTKIYLTRETQWSDTPYSGFVDSDITTKNATGSLYQSPLSVAAQCGGSSGIFFLTDGIPDSTADDGNSPSIPMNNSFRLQMGSLANNAVGTTCQDTMTDVLGPNNTMGGWKCIGAFSKALNFNKLDSTKKLNVRASNDSSVPVDPILTAVVGFGEAFNGVNPTTCTGGSIAAQNTCKWGAKGQGYGGGGFYYVAESKDIANSFIEFSKSLVNLPYNPQPGDGPTISADVTDVTRSSEFAYLPLFQPQPAKPNIVWPGNLKKYRIQSGSLFDANNNHIFSDINGQIKSNAKDFWNNTPDADGSTILAGGAYARLTAPNATTPSSTRNLYVEASSTSLAKVSVNASGAMVSSATLNVPPFTDPQVSKQRMHYLLNFLGYNVPVFNATGQPIKATDYPAMGTDPTKNAISFVPTAPIKILGSIHNSKPQEILYKFEQSITADGKVSNSETKRILFGSMDGALHLVEDGTTKGTGGEEVFAFIPSAILSSPHQVAALKDGSTQWADGTPNPPGNVAFGVDAPWHVRSKYCRIYGEDKVTIQAKDCVVDGVTEKGFVKVYGGLGRGGIGFYGLDITEKGANVVPKVDFKITVDTPGFSQLGHTWSKPMPAKVKAKDNNGNDIIKDVLFVSGGYDLCYDNADFNLGQTNTAWAAGCQNLTAAKGNAIYMIDADTGALLWTASNVANSVGGSGVNEHIKHSIPAEVSVVDYNGNGLVDNIYFADLGGQVFRADFNDAVTIDQPNLWNLAVTRLMVATDNKDIALPTPARFYERPIITPYYLEAKGDGIPPTIEVLESGKFSQLRILVSVASGDRNSPIAKINQHRADKDKDNNRLYNPNRLYTIWDAEFNEFVERSKDNPPSKAKLLLVDKKMTDFVKLKRQFSASTDILDATEKNELYQGIKAGWYDDLTYFSGDNSQDTTTTDATTNVTTAVKKVKYTTPANSQGNDVDFLQAIGQPVVRAGRLYVTVFNPQAYIPAPTACTPVPTGVTEAQSYCLPFGVCDGGTNGRGSTAILGSGIATASLGRVGVGDNPNDAALISTEINLSGQKTKDSDGNEVDNTLTRDKILFHSLYELVPTDWFERTPTRPSAAPTTGVGGGQGANNP